GAPRPRFPSMQTGVLDEQANDEADDWDPWQPFNERMFFFNHDILDRYLIKPADTGWSKVEPEAAPLCFAALLDTHDMTRRVVNNLLQARPLGPGRELARFVVNTTAGVGGLFDVASAIDIEPSNADAGETLALYEIGR